MGLKRKIRQTGNSAALPIPNEIFEFLELNSKKCRYKLCQDETGSVYVLILGEDVMMIDEKKFQKLGGTAAIIIPKTLCKLWNIGLEENQNRELELTYYNSPLKWKLAPV